MRMKDVWLMKAMVVDEVGAVIGVVGLVVDWQVKHINRTIGSSD
jgi:hypothetical protein